MINGLIIFGAEYFYLFGAAVFVLYFILLARKKELRVEMIIFGLLTLVIAYVTAKILGHFFFNPRPFVAEHFTSLIAHDSGNGFPSDHALLVSTLGAILYPYNKRTSILVFLVAFLVGIARVYAGVHHPLDIIGSMVIAVAASFVAYILSKPTVQYFTRNKWK